jgi:hypothetical protein
MGGQVERKAERKAKRSKIKLRNSLISPQLLKQYQAALIQVVNFLTECNLLVSNIEELDDAVCAWLEHIFYEGEAKGLASDSLASIQYHLPRAAGHLRMSWKLVRAFAGACVRTRERLAKRPHF